MPEDFKNLLNDLLYSTAQQKASDLHISPGHYPTIRVDGRLISLTDNGILAAETISGMLLHAMHGKKSEKMAEKGEVNFSYSLENKARFRISAYKTRGLEAAVFRYIPQTIGSLEELNLPNQVAFFSRISQGLVLVVSPHGNGKTTTAASLIDLINKQRYEKIITIEHPVEYIFNPDKSVIDQREIHTDMPSFEVGLKYLAGKDVNVVMMSELDSPEKVLGAIEAAEGGMLVIATVSSPASAQAIEKIISISESFRQNEIRLRLSNVLSGIVSQKLVPRITGGLVPAAEVVIANPAIRSLIRERKLGQLGLVIDTSVDIGMISLNRSLVELIRRNEISVEQAEFHSLNRTGLKSLLK